jgi:glycosyltransferase involved in cell wall biosynthesis
MRILHAVHSLTSGGAERQLQLLCREWTDATFEHAIFCVRSEGNAIPPAKARIFRAASAAPYSAAYWRSLRVALREFDPDVVHAWLPASVTIPAMLLGALGRRRVVFSYRSRMQFHRLLSYPEFAVALACADRIVSNNPIVDSRPAFRWLFRRKRGTVIRNAVAIPPGLARAGPFPRTGGEWRFACVGRLTAAKNLHAVVEAASLLPAGLRWRLDVYGDGELRGSLQAAIAAKGLGGRVTLHGYCADVYRRMVEADVLLMPSLWEGMPNVALESLALGVPLLISDIPPHRELLPAEGTVMWVPPRSPAAIAGALAACAAGSVDLAGMADRGCAFAAAFGPERMVAAYRDFYAVTGR